MRKPTGYKGNGSVVSTDATITESGAGGFTAVASTGSLDRDGEILRPGALNPLPASIPCHLDHVTSASNVVARARPYYLGPKLMIDARFDSGPDGQEVRRKVAEGLLDSVSVVFLAEKWETVNGVRTLVKGELLACDIVSVPSQADARILSARSLGLAMREVTADARADALLALVAADIAAAKEFLAGDYRGPNRRAVDAELRKSLTQVDYRPKPTLHTMRSTP